MYLVEIGLISPTVKTFGANDIVTREEVAVIIANIIGLDGTQRATKFSDVPASHRNSGYIQSAVEAGIINGYSDGTFKPNQKVTRGHMATFISRTFELPNGNKTFKDVPKGHTAYEAVSQLVKAGITTGYEDGTFKPNANLTRAHVSTLIARTIKYFTGTMQEEGDYILDPEMRELVSELGFMKSNINQEDSYYEAIEKSVEPFLVEKNHKGGLCSFFSTFALCVAGESELTAVEIYPDGSLTVSDLKKN